VQSAGDVAKAGEIELLDRPPYRLADGPHGLTGEHRFFHETRAVGDAELFDLCKTRPTGDQDDPGIAGIVHQPRGAKLQIAELEALFGDRRRDGEGLAHPRLGTATQ